MTAQPPLWLTLPALAWLAGAAYHDFQRREVPHLAWTGLPFAVAAVWRGLSGGPGGWALAGLAAGVLVISERQHLPAVWAWRLIGVTPIILGSLALASGPAYLFGAVCVVVFWLGFERRLWGGADAMAAITLVLLWPDYRWLLCWGLVCLGFSLGVRITGRFRDWRSLGHLPGLPLLLAATTVYLVVA